MKFVVFFVVVFVVVVVVVVDFGVTRFVLQLRTILSGVLVIKFTLTLFTEVSFPSPRFTHAQSAQLSLFSSVFPLFWFFFTHHLFSSRNSPGGSFISLIFSTGSPSYFVFFPLHFISAYLPFFFFFFFFFPVIS